MPGLTMIFSNLSDGMRGGWPLVRVPRGGKWKPLFSLSMALGGAALLARVLAGVILPFVSLLQAITTGR